MAANSSQARRPFSSTAEVKKPSNTSTAGSLPSHSSWIQSRSDHYHKNVAVTKIQKGSSKMTQARSQRDNNEESDEEL